MAGVDDWNSRFNWETWNGDLPFWQHAFCGSIAGIAEHICLFPLDTIKTRLQTSNNSLSQIAWNNKAPFGGLFRGTQAIVIGCIPAHIAYFTLYEFISNWNRNSGNNITKQSDHNVNVNVNKSKFSRISSEISTTAMAGAVATIGHDILLVPADMMKQRLQLGCYKSMIHCLKCVIKEEGSCAFYRSFPTTLFMNIPFQAILVAVNEYIKSNVEFMNSKNNLPSLSGYFISAGIGGALAAFLTNPLDVIKTKIQTQGIKGVGNNSKTVFTVPFVVAKNIYKIRGLSGFMRGSIARIAICTPAAAISWGTYETIKMLIS